MHTGRPNVWGWVVLGVLLAAGVPLSLCMPPWADVTMYDVASRKLLAGGVLYRDVFDTNFPGGIWLQTLVRGAFGWRYDTLRAFDLLVVSAVLWLMLDWLRALGIGRSARLWSAVAVAAYYVFQPEDIHCQRDVWMLLPVLLALRIRRQKARIPIPDVPGRAMAVAACEGLLWGAAIWIKPFVLVPALACWITWAWLARRARSTRDLAIDAAGMLLGGLAAGALGIAWLMKTGAFPYFIETQLRWNPDYAAHVYGLKVRSAMIRDSIKGNLPWVLVHAAAAPAAFALLTGRGRVVQGAMPAGSIAGPLLGALYWGWLLQAALLQPRLHNYQVASMLLVAIPLGLTVGVRLIPRQNVRRAAVALAAMLVAFRHPVLRLDRLALWPAAVTQGSTVALRDRLSLMGVADSTGIANWTDLERVARFLASRHAGDEFICFGESTNALYLMMNVTPSFRFIQSNLIVHVMHSHHEDVMREIAASGARFVVTDLSSILVGSATATEAVPPPWNARYPWTLPVVFRAGRYFVHEPAAPVTQYWP